jgi:hypothetical protein
VLCASPPADVSSKFQLVWREELLSGRCRLRELDAKDSRRIALGAQLRFRSLASLFTISIPAEICIFCLAPFRAGRQSRASWLQHSEGWFRDLMEENADEFSQLCGARGSGAF